MSTQPNLQDALAHLVEHESAAFRRGIASAPAEEVLRITTAMRTAAVKLRTTRFPARFNDEQLTAFVRDVVEKAIEHCTDAFLRGVPGLIAAVRVAEPTKRRTIVRDELGRVSGVVEE